MLDVCILVLSVHNGHVVSAIEVLIEPVQCTKILCWLPAVNCRAQVCPL